MMPKTNREESIPSLHTTTSGGLMAAVVAGERRCQAHRAKEER